MTEADDHALEGVDRAAQAASRGLHAHVDRQVDPELVLAALPSSAPQHRRGRLLAAAAVAALFVGSVAVLSDDGTDERSRLEVDEDGHALPDPEPGTLTVLGPKDGLNSVRLPITVEPNVDLEDGDVVTVTGPGFVPGEQVGIVQCAREDSDPVGERRVAGIDGCQTAGVQYAHANDEGVATGTYTVRRILTTPATGTVDCALESKRCIVAMGALDDYDRSGGFEVSFAGGGEPLDMPTMSVEPATGLADGYTVHVVADDLLPDSLVFLEVCSVDPAACWQTGEAIEVDADDHRGPEYVDGGVAEGTSSYLHVGLVADGEGRAEGDVPVWRYLPAGQAGRYADCAVSVCALRLHTEGGNVPEPVQLGFAPGGTAPRPPGVAVDPTRDLEPGQEVVVRGTGFEPGSHFSISLCASPADSTDDDVLGCWSTQQGQDTVDPDGGFATTFTIPSIDDMDELTATTMCAPDGACEGSPVEYRCDGVEVECSIRVDSYPDEPAIMAPQFPPAPVPITLRR